ncbi:MAG: DUF2817 domain-containing protein [Methyloprofundus sp.]|nr:DUF2817 domain-containing protein [Methyloprofundus sp.]MBW6452208.1 M14 family metallopeptidase [Methyloprofundus sp.]
MHRSIDCFSKEYSEARDKFLMASQSVDGTLTAYKNTIPDLELELVTHVLYLGAKQASNLLVLISATHGVEGYCGSAAQIDFLQHLPKIDSDTAVLIIHALNPYGFAFDRRVNEDNIDLNRNFVDFTDTPKNSDYQQLMSFLALSGLDEQGLLATQHSLKHYRLDWGDTRFEQAVCGGQYSDAHGLFYGGNKASWSHQLALQLINEFHISERQKVIVVDIHSGLGPYGYGEIISDHQPDSSGAKWARQCFAHNMTEPAAGTSSSVPKHGLMDYLWHQHFPVQGCYVTLEFGTFSVDKMFAILQQENYCWHNPVSTAQKQSIQKQLRGYFYPEYQDWQEMVLFRCQQIITMSLKKLAHE